MLISPLNTASFPVPLEYGVEPDPMAVPPARRLVVAIARHWQVPMSDDALRDLELCASEVIANALEHARARCKVTVRWTGERLRVEVADNSLRPPGSDTTEDAVTGGRGLILVDGLAHSWGWHPAGSGKVVWFECAADQLVTGERRLAVLVHAAHNQAAERLARSA
ncbi:ATP-binding protein [Kitasatospora aureofaciens]|uniref:ATP-binding protein n=1 Tax=Kitasatospora aureofaciens TaxID=1894 RepID=UPI001C4842F7|nr:ATP-binding protein [Kitasatospora aureofaciens]MBV6699286.1 ATP-binding protein [Kitasatospora aureofaciens]